MSVNPNQSWITPNTSLFSSGGSNFPSGIDIGSYVISPSPTSAWGQPALFIQQYNTPNNQATLEVDNLLALTGSGGTDDKSCLINASTIQFQGNLGTGVGSVLVSAIDNQLGSGSAAFNLTNISSITGTINTTDTNATYIPSYFTIRPDEASKGGNIFSVWEYDAVDTGANYALVAGANNSNAFLSAVWPGYISMPLAVEGASVTIRSDNETFLYGDGSAGALGTLSTGTPFLSGSNLFSSITTPAGIDGTFTADTYALFSTLKTSFPACFTQV